MTLASHPHLLCDKRLSETLDGKHLPTSFLALSGQMANGGLSFLVISVTLREAVGRGGSVYHYYGLW